MARRGKVPRALVAGAVLLLAALAPAAAQEGRLYYQMEVTNPGTRSMGWRGMLYGPDGAPVVAEAAAVLETRLGRFRYTECQALWVPCGFLREGVGPVPSPSSITVLSDPEGWTFRAYIHAEGSRSEGWEGVLLHGATPAEPKLDGPVETPMGPFSYLGQSPTLWGWSGWVPELWDKP